MFDTTDGSAGRNNSNSYPAEKIEEERRFQRRVGYMFCHTSDLVSQLIIVSSLESVLVKISLSMLLAA